ncbi:hypothetical protein DFQ28_007669 [Apophysomyces sp. BC1034]|nr:hypothetical protein DFQ30_002146 [Apophysomyces sp. BC1015]KAG0182117.1 hypothetical protein DFQ29_005616 [Apophysomyces sp. BC1021]KAG0186510.1 hypothetical protein DFQ28_007669 [Apophysomyces sp. BC1034]
MAHRSDAQEYAEDAAILRFYQLDSLEPDAWVDEVSGYHDEPTQESTLQQFSRQGDGSGSPAELPRPTPENEGSLQLMDDSDPLGVYNSIFENDMPRNNNIADLRERSTLIIANKSFQPCHFLLEVHKTTSYNDLVRGEERLRQGVNQRAEALKSLVHTNFDRFVSAKNTIDHVYDEMKSKQLNDEQDYGTRALKTALEEANAKADHIYGPIVERRQRGEKVRSTLTILQRYKFFFNLPSGLLESIKQNKYDTAIRDYKRGKYLYHTLKGEDDHADSPAIDESDDALADDTETRITDLHRKVFDRIWAEVTKIVMELQNVLLKMLADPWRSMDEQEKTIKTYKSGVDKIRQLRSTGEVEESDILRNLSLKKAIGQIQTKHVESGLERDPDLRIWRAISDLVKSLSALMLRCLPDFWRLSKAFIEGKFARKASMVSQSGTKRRGQGVDLTKVEQCQRMTRNIVDLYASLIANHFALDEKHVQAEGSEQEALPEFLPPNANSVYVAEHLIRIFADLASCVNDIHAIHLSGETFSGLTDLKEKARWKFVEVVCRCWERDARTFYMLEEWILDPECPHYTGLLKRYYDYHKFCARSAHKIASLMAVTDEQQQQVHIDQEYVHIIRYSFMESMYKFLDGLVKLAFSDYKPLTEKGEILIAIQRDKIDVHSMDVRILLTVINLAHMRSTVMRKLVGLFETAYRCNMDEELRTLTDIVDQLDQILFNDYIKRKSTAIRDTIRQGILHSGIDWYSISKPTEVHSFVYEALMTLVMVHAQISAVAHRLIHRALSSLLENMATDCLESFRQVERFGMGGMLQATLEIEFMHQTLSQYVTSAASDTLQLIYQTIEQAYDQQQQLSGNLQSELSHVKEILVFSRKSTVVQFLCFKQNRERRKV